MTYTLCLTRHRRLEDVKSRAPDTLTLEDLRACLRLLERSRPVECVQRPDGATWVFRKGEPQASFAPLCSAGVRPNNGPKTGTLELSLSHTSPFFLANLYELLTWAALVNEELGLFAFEPTHGLSISVESLPKLLDTGSEHILAQGRLSLQRREALYTDVRMPFELPAGQHDDATNMLLFRLKPPRPLKLPVLLGEPPEGLVAEVDAERGVWASPASGQPVTWFMRNPHAANELLVWPHWGEAPFIQVAHETFAVAERLHARAGGKLLWNDAPCTPKRMEWLRRYPHLLAVELMQLLTLGWEPCVREG